MSLDSHERKISLSEKAAGDDADADAAPYVAPTVVETKSSLGDLMGDIASQMGDSE
jgi:hypothetical protein